MWATATTKRRVPKLEAYLIAAQPQAEPKARRVAKMGAALAVLSAQYGIPLRPRREGVPSGQ
jgi:hypothetical protein